MMNSLHLCKFQQFTLFNIVCNFASRSLMNPLKLPERCQPHEYRCFNGECIRKLYRCDGVAQCQDTTDEVNCSVGKNPRRTNLDNKPKAVRTSFSLLESIAESEPKLTPTRKNLNNNDQCKQEQYMCRDGECIPIKFRCDGHSHCSDNSDEVDCSECPDNFGKCSRGECIPTKYFCDGLQHCIDGFDEKNCPESTLPEEIQSLATEGSLKELPIPLKKARTSFSLAEDSLSGRCPPNSFQCESGNCIQEIFRCDGQKQCIDGSDEMNCTEIKECPVDFAKCASGGCIPMKFLCDGQLHCIDGSDEDNCFVYHVGLPIPKASEVAEGTKCHTGDFQCGSGNCIPVTKVCDETQECLDGLDERFCYGKLKSLIPVFETGEHEDETENVCVKGNFRCSTDKCLDVKLLCNGYPNCEDGLDEVNCYFGCRIGNFQCNSNKECINVKFLCNGYDNCIDGADEQACYALGNLEEASKQPRDNSCRVGSFQCKSDYKCLDVKKVCDGNVDCEDNSDEENCFNYLGPPSNNRKGRKINNDAMNTSPNQITGGLTSRRFPGSSLNAPKLSEPEKTPQRPPGNTYSESGYRDRTYSRGSLRNSHHHHGHFRRPIREHYPKQTSHGSNIYERGYPVEYPSTIDDDAAFAYDNPEQDFQEFTDFL